MKIVVIANSLSQPRIIKRIESLSKLDCELKIYGYDRGIYTCNSLPKSLSVEILGAQKDGVSYKNKFSQVKNDISNIISKEGKNDVLYYAFGFIQALFLFAQKVKYIYEISDIVYAYKKFALVSPFVKILDKKIIAQSKVTILTSEGFADYFYGDNRPQNIIIHPNKLNSFFNSFSDRKVKDIDINHLVFSFIGAIRYPDTILRFAKIIGKYYPQHEFHFYGESSYEKDFKLETKEYSNVKYFGKFNNPKDLGSIYSKVDVVVACYDVSSLNEKIAEPNKLYESLFFCKPIIVSTTTFLSKQVEKYGCGFSIDAHEDKNIINLINCLDYNVLNNIVETEFLIDRNTLIDNSDKLISSII